MRAAVGSLQLGAAQLLMPRLQQPSRRLGLTTRGLLRTFSDKKLLIILNYHGTLCGGSAAMQIRSLMQPGAFGPEAIAAMGDALDAALKELQDIGRSDVQSDVVRETIAGRIIGAARLGERDPARLRAAALSGVTGRRD